MAGLKKKVPNRQGIEVDATMVQIEETTERFNEIRLKEGTTLNLKTTILEVVRFDEWDADGNPYYGVKSQNILTVVQCPDDLKRPSQESVQ